MDGGERNPVGVVVIGEGSVEVVERVSEVDHEGEGDGRGSKVAVVGDGAAREVSPVEVEGVVRVLEMEGAHGDEVKDEAFVGLMEVESRGLRGR